MANGRVKALFWWRRRTQEEQAKWTKLFKERCPHEEITGLNIYSYFYDRHELKEETIKNIKL